MQVRGSIACRAIALALLVLAGASSAATPNAGSTNRQYRDDAIKAMPLAQLDSEDRARVTAVLENVTLYRHLPTQTIECDARLFQFLIEHPEVVINMWRVMNITDIHVKRLDEVSFDADDHAGTRGKLRYLVRSPHVHVIYGEGKYEGMLLPKPVRGQAVFLLRTSTYLDRQGKPMVQARLDSFVRMEAVTVEVLAKTFQPLVGHVADHNYRETAVFLNRIHKAAQVNPEGLMQLVDQLEGVDEKVASGFNQIADEIGAQAALAEKQQPAIPGDRSAELPTRQPTQRR
ncbi:MAG: hypothetical protein JSS27_13750 [Planctomycetes bacterium]|nr:hypothetical protein [Planctomycetota bacterium]